MESNRENYWSDTSSRKQMKGKIGCPQKKKLKSKKGKKVRKRKKLVLQPISQSEVQISHTISNGAIARRNLAIINGDPTWAA